MTGRAPGKLILCGEHAVVAGFPAVALALPLYTEVRLRPRQGPTGVESAIVDTRLRDALLRVIPAEGYTISITSDLPTGCGLGSSAALAVATVRAWEAVCGRTPSFEEVFAAGFEIERAFHGNPSGVDHAVSALGGVVHYRKQGPVLRRLDQCVAIEIVVVNTGTPNRTTAEMVAAVAARNPLATFAYIGDLVEQVARRLEAGEPIGALLDANHQALVELGVSTPELDAACVALRRAGATGAKLAGAGGGGVAFGICEASSAQHVLARLGQNGWALQV